MTELKFLDQWRWKFVRIGRSIHLTEESANYYIFTFFFWLNYLKSKGHK